MLTWHLRRYTGDGVVAEMRGGCEDSSLQGVLPLVLLATAEALPQACASRAWQGLGKS